MLTSVYFSQCDFNIHNTFSDSLLMSYCIIHSCLHISPAPRRLEDFGLHSTTSGCEMLRKITNPNVGAFPLVLQSRENGTMSKADSYVYNFLMKIVC